MLRGSLLRRLCTSAAPPKEPPAAVTELIATYGPREPRPVTIQMMRTMSSSPESRLSSSEFVREELLIRTTAALRLVHALGMGLAQSPPVQRLISSYWDQMLELESLPLAVDEESDATFTGALAKMKSVDSYVVPILAEGVQELSKQKTYTDLGLREQTQVSREIDQFLTQRLSMRMIQGQYIETKEHSGGRVAHLLPADVVQTAAEAAAAMCELRLGVKAPEVKVVGGSAPFVYITSHLHLICFELLKNSMQAVIDSGSDQPIKIIISQGSEDVTIKISDRGGGIPRSEWPKLWLYTYTTHSSANVGSQAAFRQQFSGGGYGLPYAKVISRYLGGDVTLLSMEGYGTDAYVQLGRMGNSREVLPAVARGVAPLKQ